MKHDFGHESILFKIVPIFIGIVFVIVIGGFIGYAIIAVKVIQNPEAVAEGAGRFLKIFKEAAGF
ncbi:MAG: hypothetical protein HGA35_05260 [Erysipelotrichaceae bacterium]|nr:hypothetical protein [Erysipelotrichaceae bacterium]